MAVVYEVVVLNTVAVALEVPLLVFVPNTVLVLYEVVVPNVVVKAVRVPLLVAVALLVKVLLLVPVALLVAYTEADLPFTVETERFVCVDKSDILKLDKIRPFSFFDPSPYPRCSVGVKEHHSTSLP